MAQQSSNDDGGRRKKVLFVGEAVTLSHVGRPALLARMLDRERFDVALACDQRVHGLLSDRDHALPLIHHRSMDPKVFLSRLAGGKPIFDRRWLDSAILDDASLIESWSPDLIVGDFRVSLSISARLAGVPYMAISDAYWSPYCSEGYPTPDLPGQGIVSPRIFSRAFEFVRPLAFRHHGRALNNARKRAGLPDLGSDLGAAYCDADFVAYPEEDGVTDLSQLPDTHRFVGSLPWAPSMARPDWLHELSDRPTVYVCLGSSGPSAMLNETIHGLARLNINVTAASCGAFVSEDVRRLPNVWVEDYLPGSVMAEQAQLVICNGGSTASQQALLAGTPVLGVASNMDQLMNMRSVERLGAGICRRAGQSSGLSITQAARVLLHEQSFRQGAERFAAVAKHSTARRLFPHWVSELCGVDRRKSDRVPAMGRSVKPEFQVQATAPTRGQFFPRPQAQAISS